MRAAIQLHRIARGPLKGLARKSCCLSRRGRFVKGLAPGREGQDRTRSTPRTGRGQTVYRAISIDMAAETKDKSGSALALDAAAELTPGRPCFGQARRATARVSHNGVPFVSDGEEFEVKLDDVESYLF